jgi:hypothetical protein
MNEAQRCSSQTERLSQRVRHCKKVFIMAEVELPVPFDRDNLG